MLGKLYEALRAGNTPESQAREAAEEVAAYENRLSSVESELRLIRWMVGMLYPLVLAILVKLFVS